MEKKSLILHYIQKYNCLTPLIFHSISAYVYEYSKLITLCKPLNIPYQKHYHDPEYSWNTAAGGDSMVVGFTTTCAITAYHHWHCEFESRSCGG